MAADTDATGTTDGGTATRTDADPSREDRPDPGAVRFEEIDWEAMEGRDLRVSLRTGSFLVLFGALVAFYLYDVYVATAGDPTVWITPNALTGEYIWVASQVDWLTLFLGAVVVAVGVVPALADPSKVRDAWRAYPKDPLSLAALVYVFALVVVGLFGPAFLDPPTLQFDQASQPPVLTEVPMKYINMCAGPTAGGACQGTWATPLGTTTAGESVLVWMVYGARTTLQFALISGVLMVPIATLVGATAAYFGGRYDAVLMRYVEVQNSVPTVVVYLLLVIFVGPTLFVLIVAYGLFNWGDMARLVRSETQSLAEEEFVTAAQSAGAGRLTVVRRHLIPNLSGTVVASLGMVIPKLVLIEALFSFLGLGGDQSYSWGQLVQRGLLSGSLDGSAAVDMSNFEGLWWIPILPAVAISLTVLAFFLVGDAVQTVLDPERD